MIDPAELSVLAALDAALATPGAVATIDALIPDLERQLDADPDAVMSWAPLPLETYAALPPAILSSWVFILAAGKTTGAERHPNSHQRMVSYRGHGDFPVERDGHWVSQPLVSDRSRSLEERWVSIPSNVWHQGIVPDAHWVVVSFHTVRQEDLIEERRGASSSDLERRNYIDPR